MLLGNKSFLRAVERSDLRQLLEWRNNPEFRKYFREHRELNWEQQTKWFEEIVLKCDNVRMFSICNLDQQLIGACGLCHINWAQRSADFSIYIGYNNLYIDEEYAIDAGKTIIQYGFTEMNLHRLWVEIYDFDKRKKRMFEHLGFVLDGRHKHTQMLNGKWHDSLFYRLLSDH